MIITVNGVSLFYEVTGAGSPLLMLHGNGEDHTIFDKLTAKLSANYTVYAIDSRGHGQSEKTDDYSYETMAEDVYAFIQKLSLEDVNLVGFSDGAIIGLMLAMEHSEVVGKMALLGINLSPKDFTEDSYQYVKETYEETKDPLFKLMLEQPNIELHDVRKVDTPIFLVAADDDIFKSESFRNLASALPNAKLKFMEGHDHDSYISNQDILYPDLIRFFESNE